MEQQQLLNQRQRKRLARKIHDEISQKMTLLSLQLSMASTEAAPPANWAASCENWSNLVMELGQTVREITNELQPRIVDESGFVAALRWFAQSSSKKISCQAIIPRQDFFMATFAGNELFEICREIVLDILVPAGVPGVEIELDQKEGIIRLQLRTTAAGGGLELMSDKMFDAVELPQRLQSLDGTAEFSRGQDGVVVALTLPSSRPAPCVAH